MMVLGVADRSSMPINVVAEDWVVQGSCGTAKEVVLKLMAVTIQNMRRWLPKINEMGSSTTKYKVFNCYSNNTY